MGKKILVLVMLIAALFAGGCSSLFSRQVAPFDREYLARTEMQLIARPTEETGKQHMFNAREGSVGGFGGAGGGCGCN